MTEYDQTIRKLACRLKEAEARYNALKPAIREMEEARKRIPWKIVDSLNNLPKSVRDSMDAIVRQHIDEVLDEQVGNTPTPSKFRAIKRKGIRI